MHRYLLYLILLLTPVIACKKGDGGSDTSGKHKNISAIKQASTEYYLYSYDGTGRMQRIAPSPSSYSLVEYMDNGMVIRSYDASDNEKLPRYEFNMPEGRVISCVAYLPNDRVLNNSYTYDAEGKLIRHFVTDKKTSTDKKIGDNTTYYTYAGNNVSRVVFVSTYVNTYEPRQRDDSMVVDFEYYTDKKHFTWSDIGFTCFGTANTFADTKQGGNLFSPWPSSYYITPDGIFPTGNPVKKRIEKLYDWDPATKKWQLQRNETQNMPEADYKFDADGKLLQWTPWMIQLEWK